MDSRLRGNDRVKGLCFVVHRTFQLCSGVIALTPSGALGGEVAGRIPPTQGFGGNTQKIGGLGDFKLVCHLGRYIICMDSRLRGNDRE